MDPVIVKVSFSEFDNHLLTGTRTQAVASQLRINGIPCSAGPNGIHVTSGELQVHDEGLQRIFTWLPPAPPTNVPPAPTVLVPPPQPGVEGFVSATAEPASKAKEPSKEKGAKNAK